MATDESMVERVARAMSERDVASLREFLAKEGLLARMNECEQLLPWDKMNQRSTDDYRSRARTAIAAMREPSGEMVDAGAELFYEVKGDDFTITVTGQPTAAWQAMIDTALKG